MNGRAAGLVGFLGLLAGCGGGGPSAPVASGPAPAPSATPTPAVVASPPVSSNPCGLAPGPVARLAIAPRQQFEDNVSVPMRVRVLAPYTDEVWCVDRDREHKLDFNANQRNAGGRECCWQGEVGWAVRDNAGIVTGHTPQEEYAFIYRFRLDPGGRSAQIRIFAELDDVASHPWQSDAGYAPGPLVVESMSRQEIERDCTCVYLGNGGYDGRGCPKVGP